MWTSVKKFGIYQQPTTSGSINSMKVALEAPLEPPKSSKILLPFISKSYPEEIMFLGRVEDYRISSVLRKYKVRTTTIRV